MARQSHFRWNKDDELYPIMEELLADAALKGYSAVELSRMMGHSTCKNMYSMMRDAGILAKLPRKRWPKFDTHPALLAALARCKLSFAQWTNSHDLEPTVTAQVLKTIVDPADPQSVDAHKALKQDFQFLAEKMYGLPVPLSRVSDESDGMVVYDYAMTIKPDQQRGGYTAYVHQLEECCVFARTMELAFYELKSRYVLFNSVRKLKVLLKKEVVTVPTIQ